MSAELTFIGDEASAAGYRLAGTTVQVPAAGEEASALQRAHRESALVLISAECAARIPKHELSQALTALSPLILVVMGLHEAAPGPDLGARLRAQLGFEP